MPVIVPIAQTDTLDQWRQKDNEAINALNNQGINSIVQIQMPLNNQDILVYNSTDGFFENVGIAAFVSAVITELATIPTSNLKPYYFASLRTIF